MPTASLLAHAGFILEPGLDPLGSRTVGGDLRHADVLDRLKDQDAQSASAMAPLGVLCEFCSSTG